MPSAGTVTVDFEARTARFAKELAGTKGQLNSLEGSFKGAQRAARRFLNVAGIIAATAAITRFATRAASAADEFGKTADRIGLGTERLAAFQLAAQRAGVDLGKMNQLLLSTQRRLGQAAAGGGAAKFIRQLGLDIRELQQLSPDQLFLRYSQSIATLENRSDRLAAAQALMGEAARDAINLIENGNPAIREAQRQVERYGLALSRVDIKAIEIANDKLSLLGKISGIAGQRIQAGLTPFIDAMAEAMLDATGNTEDLQKRVEVFGATAYTAFQVLANGARTLQSAFFGLAAAGARLLEATTFGDVSEAFAASVEANLAKAQGALDQIRSIEQIQQGIVDTLEEARRKASDAVQQDIDRRGGERGSSPITNQAEAARKIAEATAEMGRTVFAALMEQTRQAREESFQQMQEYGLRELEFQIQMEEQRLAHENRVAEQSHAVRRFWLEQDLAADRAAQEAIVAQRAAATNAAIALLQVFAQKSKTAAIALVVINRAKAIAEAIQNTAVGVTLQLTSGDPYTALARAAAVKAFGAIQVAAIAATGYGEISQIRGGNAGAVVGPGTPHNPIFTTSGGDEERQIGADSRSATHVHIHGNVFSSQETADWIIERLREATNDHDAVFISHGSRQAQDLRDG
jgi:hypothetical protein